MKELNLTDLVPVEMLQKIQEACSQYTGMATVTTDVDGKPITKETAFSDFCIKYTRQSELGCTRCMESDKTATRIALETGKPAVYVCHAGLMDFASPIMLENKLIGCFMGGQVRISDVDEEKVRATAEELGIEYEAYYKAMLKTKKSSERTIQKTAEFLGMIASIISEMAYQNYLAIDQYRKLERAARSQSHFLMDLSTDLHKNMSEWITALKAVVENGSVDTVMDVIDTMLTNGTATYSIIGDIVDYMKFSDGNVELYETPYRIREVVQTVVEQTAEEAAGKNIRILCEIGEEVPELLLGDSGRIGQILTKLISNALKQKGQRKNESEVRIIVSAEKQSYAHKLSIKLLNSERNSPEEAVAMQKYFSRDILDTQSRDVTDKYAFSIIDLFVRQMQGNIAVRPEDGGVFSLTVELPQLKVSES